MAHSISIPQAPASSPRLDPQSRRWTLLAAAACLLPLLLQLPPRIAIALIAVGSTTAALSWRRPLPGWIRAILAIGLVGGVFAGSGFSVGRDTGCALLAAMLAIKPAETSTLRDARSLLGFALFAPFATFLLDQGPLSWALSLLGALLVLWALQRLTELEAGLPAASGWSWSGGKHALRLLLIGLPLALAAFWLFPRLPAPLWGVPERAMAKTGLSDSMSPGEWIDLMGDESPALRVQFQGPTPPQSQMYWRGPVLWRFDGRTWTAVEWFTAMTAPPVDLGATRWTYEVEVEPTENRQLVALELPQSAPAGTQLSLDYTLQTARRLDNVTRWRMQAATPVSFQADLNPMMRRLALSLPADYNPRTVALGVQWRREAGADDQAVIDRALAMIRAEFAYTLDTPLLGRNHVDEFLFDVKAGFCEHYSSAFVVLMRAAGIPARVVTGYVGGVYNRLGDYWLVRRSDAHAWAEVWLPGRGWVRVDPTAAVAPERIYDTIADRQPGTIGGFSALAPAFQMSDWVRRGWNDFVLGFNADRQQHLLRPLGLERIDPGVLSALFVAAIGLALAWMAWLTARAERQRDPLLHAWHRLGQRYARLGLGRQPHEPAQAWAARVAAQRPQSQHLASLSAHFADWRYASPQDRKGTRDDLLRALRRHRP